VSLKTHVVWLTDIYDLALVELISPRLTLRCTAIAFKFLANN
jgi:hypothetical protein